ELGKVVRGQLGVSLLLCLRAFRLRGGLALGLRRRACRAFTSPRIYSEDHLRGSPDVGVRLVRRFTSGWSLFHVRLVVGFNRTWASGWTRLLSGRGRPVEQFKLIFVGGPSAAVGSRPIAADHSDRGVRQFVEPVELAAHLASSASHEPSDRLLTRQAD